MLYLMLSFWLFSSPSSGGDLEIFTFGIKKVPIEGAIVILKTEDGEVLETKMSNGDGLTLFEDITYQKVSVLAYKEGYIPFEIKSILLVKSFLTQHEFSMPKSNFLSHMEILDGLSLIELTPQGTFPRIAYGQERVVFYKRDPIPRPTHLSGESLPDYIVLEATLSKNGKIVDVNYDPNDQKYTDLPIELSYLAKLTLQKWEFLPAVYFGRNVSVKTKIEVPFEP